MVTYSTVNLLLIKSMASAWHKTFFPFGDIVRPYLSVATSSPSSLYHFQEDVLEENLRSKYGVILQEIPLFNDVQHVSIRICLMI